MMSKNAIVRKRKNKGRIPCKTGWIPIIAAVILLYSFIVLGSYGISRAKNHTWELPEEHTYSETLKVAGIEDYAPYSYYNENGKASGLYVELIYRLGEKMGKNVDITLKFYRS